MHIHDDKLRDFGEVFKIDATEIQKHSSISVLKKRCSGNMQQIYRRTPLPGVLLKLHFGMGVLL